MLIGFSNEIAARRPGQASVALPFTVNADGWTVTWPSPPVIDPQTNPLPFAVERQGFNASGQPATVTDILTPMKRLRQPYPNQAVLTASQVTLSDFIYQTDTTAGAPNNSVRPPPKPIAMWLTRDLVHATGTTFSARLAVIHAHGRDGLPVAAVKFIATDGTNSVEQTVSAMTSRQWSGSGLHAPFFECTLDISTLNQGALCTLDAVIYPWVGAAFHVGLDADPYPSANLTVLKFLCDRTGAYGTAYAYVQASAGGTPQVSTSPATAAANPYATVAAAATAIQTFNSTNFGRNSASGGIIRLKPGTHARTSFSSVAVTEVPLVIEADIPANKSSVIFTDNGTTQTNGIPDKTVWRNMTFRKLAGSVQFLDANATLANLGYLCALENVHIDQNGQSAYDAWIYRLGRLWLEDVTGGWSNIFNIFSTTSKHITMVGCSGPWQATGLYRACASRITAARIQSQPGTANGQPTRGMFLSHCHLTNSAQQAIVSYSIPIDDRGLGLAMTVIEQTAGLTQAALNISTASTQACDNAVRVGLTVVGARSNEIYQDAGSTLVPKSGWEIASVHRGRNHKADLFSPPDGNRTGNWPVVFQVGMRNNAVIRGGEDNAPPGTTGAWVGEVVAPGTQYGTEPQPLAVAWVSDRSFDGTQAGGGDYTPGPGSVLGTLPAGLVHYPIDMLGRPLPLDGTAVVGALQKLP